MIPWAVGRMVREIPSRMLRVASVAMMDGILTPRTRPALTRPTPTPMRRIAPAPIRIPVGLVSAPIMKEATTTPRLIIAPTERSMYPTRRAWVWAMVATISGVARMRIWETLVVLTNPGNRELVYQTSAPRSRI